MCCPLQGGSNLQSAHEPVNPKPVIWTSTLKKTFVLTLEWTGHGRYQLDSYQMKLNVYWPWIPFVLEVLASGFDLQGSRIKWHELPRCYLPPRPEALGQLHGSLLTSRTDLLCCPDVKDRMLSWVSIEVTGLHLTHQKPLQLLNWKNCIKRLKNDKTPTHRYTSHRFYSPKEWQTHYVHIYHKSSVHSFTVY